MRIKSYKSGMLWVSIVVLAMCVSLLQAEPECASAPKPVEAAKEAPPADPYADTQVLVEAFVVEVSTEGLKALGVSPLGQTPDGISIAKLTDCLMKGDNAKVVSGAKVVVKQEGYGQAEDEKTIYLKHIRKNPLQTPPTPNQPASGESVAIEIRDYKSKKEFESRSCITSENTISVGYIYQESGFIIDPQDYDPNDFLPPNTYNYKWKGLLIVQPGKPQIAAAVQNKDNVVFLVLTATIQKDTPIETPAAVERSKKSK